MLIKFVAEDKGGGDPLHMTSGGLEGCLNMTLQTCAQQKICSCQWGRATISRHKQKHLKVQFLNWDLFSLNMQRDRIMFQRGLI